MSACDRCLALSTLTPRLARVLQFPVPGELDGDPLVAAQQEAQWRARVGEAQTPAELLALASGVSPDRAGRIIAGYPGGWSPERLREQCAQASLQIACRCDSERYPPPVQQVSDAPPVVYIRGDAELLARCPDEAVAMVGTRRPTLVGRDAARRIAAGLSRAGGLVVSGMALGIDAASHEGALSVGAPTIAVLASGADRPSPHSHRRLYAQILEHGAVVSELPPGCEPARWSFPARNRVIAALAKLTLVVEAPLRSGALITVDHAQDLGREVWAVPGSLASDVSEGTNRMLVEGAQAVIDGAELAAAIGLERLAGLSGPTEGPLAAVHAALERGPLSTAELGSRDTGLGPGDLELALLDLELAGWVSRRPDGRYRLVERWAA